MRHGTGWAYHEGCRCPECRCAWNAAKRERDHRLGRSSQARGGLSSRIPSAPLVRALAGRNQRALAHLFAARYGRREDSAYRQLVRILASDRVEVNTADEWLTLLGLHLDVVYTGDERVSA